MRRRIGIAAKGTKLAMRYADIGRIDVAIDVEIGDITVALFADVIGEPAHRQQIGRLVKRQAVFKGQAFASREPYRQSAQAARR